MALDNTVLKVATSLVTIQTQKVILIYSFKLKKKKVFALHPIPRYPIPYNLYFEYILPNGWKSLFPHEIIYFIKQISVV